MSVSLPTSDREHPDAATVEASRRAEEEHTREHEETASVAAISVAAVGTAWSAFQASLWSGKQTFALAHSSRARELAAQEHNEGNQQQNLDANLFVAYAGAYASGNDVFAKFLYDRFPPRLKVATDAWLATKPLITPGAPPHPLAMSEYRVAALEKSVALGKESDAALEEGNTANKISDTYVLGTVVFATIILLASLAVRLRRQKSRRLVLIMSAAVLLVSLAWLAVQPLTWIG